MFDQEGLPNPGQGSFRKMAPPRRNRRNSPSEQTDEAPGLIEEDQVETERDIPIHENEGIEGIKQDKTDEPPAFEE